MGTSVDEVARTSAKAGARSLWRSDILTGLARAGLVARTAFYLLLTYLTVVVATQGPRSHRQANAHGALATVSTGPFGRALLVGAAVGFLAFAVARWVSAYADKDTGLARRLTSAGQGLFYLGMAGATASYALGRHATGSEQQHVQTTARFMGLPGGRFVVAGIGVVVVAVSLWQMRVAAGEDYNDGWCVDEMPRWLRRVMPYVALAGIGARAAVFVPVGGLLVVAAVTFDPREAKGLDALLQSLSGRSWGMFVLALVAAGFATFAGYSAVESRYRDMQSGG